MIRILEDQSQYIVMSFENTAVIEKIIDKTIHRRENDGDVTNQEAKSLGSYLAAIPKGLRIIKDS